MRCYNLVFNFKIFCHNYGSIISLIFFIIYVLFMIYYSVKEISPLKIGISKLLFKESEKLVKLEKEEYNKMRKGEILKLNDKGRGSTKKLKSYPPKKEKRKIKTEDNDGLRNTEHIELVPVTKSNNKAIPKKPKRSSKHGNKIKSIYEINDIKPNEFDNEKETKLKKEELVNSAKKKAKDKLYKGQKMDNFELNNLDYKKACEFDKRGFCKTYWSILLREHVVLFTFFVWNDYNLFYIKIERFFILICTQMTVNGLFFVHESMYKKDMQTEDFTFVQKIPQLLFTLIAAHIIEVILCYLSMTDIHVYQIKALPKDEKIGERVLDIMDCMKRKLTGFFVFTFLLFLFYWYFISAFCAVYQNTQVIFLRDSGISILTSYIEPFIIYGITAVLRKISLSLCCRKRFGCIYKLSDLIPIF